VNAPQALDANWLQQRRVQVAQSSRRMGQHPSAALADAGLAIVGPFAGSGADMDVGGGGGQEAAAQLTGSVAAQAMLRGGVSLRLAGAPTLGPHATPLQSRFWCLPGGAAAPLPQGGRVLLAAARPLVERLWAGQLGRWVPTDEARLREAVRRAAIKAVYSQRLEVRSTAHAPIAHLSHTHHHICSGVDGRANVFLHVHRPL
jgi:hypothetical protein